MASFENLRPDSAFFALELSFAVFFGTWKLAVQKKNGCVNIFDADCRVREEEDEMLNTTVEFVKKKKMSNPDNVEESAAFIQSVARGWLARRQCALLAAQMYAKGWDTTYGRAYYWNDKTGYVSWTRPAILRDQTLAAVDTGDSVSGADKASAKSELLQVPDCLSIECANTTDKEGTAFLARSVEAKKILFEEHHREIMRSMRRWERQQMEEKSKARANRLATIQSDNQERLADLQQGAKAYNLKSIRQAAVHGDIGRLTELLSLGFNADASSAMGLTPLLGACQSGCLEAVKILLHHGADVNHQHVKSKRTALMEASSRESPEVVRELLRNGAKLDVKDAHGESAFDGVKDARIQRYLELAASTWTVENADLFPTPFRAAGKTLLLIQKCQRHLCSERRTATKRELAAQRPAFQRSAAEAKMRYDESVRLSHAQVTLLKKVDVLNRADAQFDVDREQLLRKIDQILLRKLEAEMPRVLSSSSIATILAFCERHWFDRSGDERHQQQRKPRRQKRKQQQQQHCAETPQPIAKRVGLHVLPHAIQAEWNDFQRTLVDQCDQLHQLQLEEQSDVDNGVMRTKDGQTLARLSVCVQEAHHLPFRDPRRHEPIDPLVRVTLRNQQTGASSDEQCTDIRLGDRHPEWQTDFSFNVESTKSDLVVQVVDFKRNEVAGETLVCLRSLLDQKDHDPWLTLPATLRQQATEKTPREHAARVRLSLRLVHTPSILLTRQIQHSLTQRSEFLRRRRAFMQTVLDDSIKKLLL